MYSTQLIQLLKALSPEEVKLLTSYLKKQPAVTPTIFQLFQYLKNCAPAYNSPKLKRATVLNYLYQQEEESGKQLNKVVFLLKQQVENFMVQQSLAQQPMQKEKLLLKVLKNRTYSGYAKRNQKLVANFEDSFDANNPLSFYHDSFELNYGLWSAVTTEKLGNNYQHLEKANADIDKYYYLLKLKIILENLIVLQLTPNAAILPNQAATLALIKEHPTFSTETLPALLLLAIQLVQTGELTQFNQLNVQLRLTIKDIPKKEARDLMVVLINFFIRHVNQFPELTTMNGFELYKFADQNQLLIENGSIRDVEYVNAATLAIDNAQFEWALAFINRNKSYLPVAIQKTTSVFLNALWLFHKKEFKAAIKLLNPVEKDKNATVSIAIKIRTLKIRALLEEAPSIEELDAKELNVLKSQVRNFSRYIYKHPSLGATKKSGYIAFCDFLQKMLKVTGPLDKQGIRLNQIQRQIELTNKLALKGWLLDKIHRIKQHLFPTTKE